MELLIVIVILGILGAVVIPNLSNTSEKAKADIVCHQMKNVSQAIKMYKLDTSSYPQTEEGLNLLVEKKYFEDGKIPKDSWGNDFIYVTTDNGFELISLGADKKESTQDDILFSKCK